MMIKNTKNLVWLVSILAAVLAFGCGGAKKDSTTGAEAKPKKSAKGKKADAGNNKTKARKTSDAQPNA